MALPVCGERSRKRNHGAGDLSGGVSGQTVGNFGIDAPSCFQARQQAHIEVAAVVHGSRLAIAGINLFTWRIIKAVMKEKSKSEVSIIGGADGPTSIFIAGRTWKKPLKVRIQNIIYRYRRKIVEKKVVADAHTLDELVQYAMNTYNLIETNSTERKYIEQQKSLKESLILQHKPEVLGEMKDIPKPDISNEESVREYFCKINTRSEMIAEMPDDVIPMNFHLYEIRIGDDSLEMEIDYIWNVFGISYYGNKKVMKQFEKISKDLYIYYGVSEDDIKKKTERYLSLVTALSS